MKYEVSSNTQGLHFDSTEARSRGMTYGQYKAATRYSPSVRDSIERMKASGNYENYEERKRRLQREGLA